MTDLGIDAEFELFDCFRIETVGSRDEVFPKEELKSMV